MTEERLALAELMEKAADGDFLRLVAVTCSPVAPACERRVRQRGTDDAQEPVQ